MRRATPAFMVLLLAACGGSGGGGGSTATPTPTPDTPDTALEWSDEFDGPAGSLADSGKWVYETMSTPPNAELEYYTGARPENGSLSGNGMLVITSRAEHYTGSDGVTREYTSARLNTSGKLETRHGDISARIKIPRGQGMWPAFWLLGANIGTVGWPACGEIDIMENIGNKPKEIAGSMHGPVYNSGNSKTAVYGFPAPVADDFHVFSVQWDKNSIRWLVDGTEYEHRTPDDVGAVNWVFEHPFFIILNNAVGGNWPGPPDSTTVFPQQMLIDYVRVSRKAT